MRFAFRRFGAVVALVAVMLVGIASLALACLPSPVGVSGTCVRVQYYWVCPLPR